jgi:YVTN family beta-propeller protein
MPSGRVTVLLLLGLGPLWTASPTGAQRVIATVTVGTNPAAVAANLTTNKIFAVNQGSNTVTVIDGATNSTSTVKVGLSPSAVAVNPVTNKIYVVNTAGNTVTVVDGGTYSTKTVPTGSSPQAVDINTVTNKIYVANTVDNTVTVIDGGNNATATVTVGLRPIAVAVNPTTNRIYTANSGDGTVTIINGATNSPTTITAGTFPSAVAINPYTNRTYVATAPHGDGVVKVIDGNSNFVIDNVYVGAYPVMAAVDPAANTIYTANADDGTVSRIDGASDTVTSVNVGGFPGALAVDPVTHQIYVVNYSWTGSVAVIDGVSGTFSNVRVGMYPDAVAVDPISNRIYVANWSDGTVSVIAGASAPALQFIPVTPCRLADTRNPKGPFGGPRLNGGTSRDFAAPAGSCGIPATAAAYSLNVTAVPSASLNYLTVWPTGQSQPTVSTLNSVDGRVKANAAIVPAGAGGAVSVFATGTTDVILDVNGYFAPAAVSTLAFYALTPCRVVDTRGATGPLGGPFLSGGAAGRDFPVTSSTCNLPESAVAYSLNFTAIPRKPLGYLTTWPTGQSQPYVSTLNAPTGVVTANAAVVPAGSGGDIDVYVSDDSDLVIDINGYFAPAAKGGLSLYATAPCRVLDTRLTTGAFSGKLSPPVNVPAAPCGVPTVAQAYVLNATVVPQGFLDYLTLWPDGRSQPLVSTLNASDGAITSNLAIVPTSNGAIDAYAANPTQLILDSFSYFGP